MFSSSIAILLAAIQLVTTATAGPLQNDGWHFDTAFVLVNEELDPIVSPNMQSSHMHKVLGGSNFRAAFSYAGAQSSTCTSVGVQADKSNYWQPSLYWIDTQTKPGTTQYAPINANPRFYYFLNPNNANDPITPFPDGLRMLAGSPNRKTASQFIGFDCHVNSDLTNDLSQDNFNFPRDCPYGMKTTLNMPNCWDGVNLYKADGSHMSYPTGNSFRGGPCPFSNPIKLPQIMLEYTWQTSRYMPGVPLNGSLAWANGDTTGYGLHGDFQNGWDRDVFIASLNDSSCVGYNAAVNANLCNTFQNTYDWDKALACKPDAGTLTESFGNTDLVPIPRLPGCNPIWGATGSKPGCDPAIPALDASKFKDVDGSYIAVDSQRRDLKLPTTPGWTKIACIGGGTSSFLNFTSFIDKSLSQDRCTSSCLKSGYQYAAVGNHADLCLCAGGISPSAPVASGQCTVPCPGNATQTCGNGYTFDVFYTAPGLSSFSSSAYSLGCYQNANDGLLPKAFYNYFSSTMNTLECNQACVNRNATWSATTMGKYCYCGNTDIPSSLGSGQFIATDLCTTPCVGNSSQTCGDSGRSNVYNLTNSGLSVVTPNKPPGWLGCYAEGTGTRALSDNSFSHSNMTAEMCMNGCSEMGFSYAGVEYSTQCYCGNAFNGGQRLPVSQCSMPCGGNTTETCGSSNILELFDTKVGAAYSAAGYAATKPANWAGCYQDSGSNLVLTDYSWSTNDMTVEICKAGCLQFGYSYSGVENGRECNCGNNPPNSQRLPSANYCTTKCPGNSTETCGSSGNIEVYNLTNVDLPDAGDSETSALLGCFADSSSSRGLSSYTYSLSTMTVAMCRTTCRELGYATSAVENGNQCFCGPTWKGTTQYPSSSCNKPCAGNSTEMCGGNNAASVYNATHAALPAKGAGWVGCYSNSAFNSYYYTSTYMTGQLCRAACANMGYAYAGTRSGNACSCGSAIAAGQTRQPYSYCTQPCVGSANETCGAGYNYDTYTTAGFMVKQSGDTNGYVGCLSDWDGKITMNPYTSTYMTPNTCVRYCKARGFQVAGLGFGNRCKCGNTMPGNLVPDSVCNATCVGNSSYICGATTSAGGSVYNVTQSSLEGVINTTPQNSTGFIGCFNEASTKMASFKSYSSSSNSPSLCGASCKALGYSISGVESGVDCYCTNLLNITSGGYRVANTECNTICPSGVTTCGGTYKLAAYDAAMVANSGSAASGTNSSTPAAPTAEGYNGCYLPGTFQSTAGYTYTTSLMTTDVCRRNCRLKGFNSAGLTNGNTCLCGDQSLLGVKQPAALCDKPCQGNTTQTCGGGAQISSYDVTGAGSLPPVAGVPANYLGCFQDGTPRQLGNYTFSNSGMTSAMCVRSCTQQGYTLAGDSGNQCFCGTTVPLNLLPDSQCNTACPGIASEICGGSWKISVFASDYAARIAGQAPKASSSAASSTAASTRPASTLAVSSTKPVSSSAVLPTAATSTVKASSSVATSTLKPSTSVATSTLKPSTSAATSTVKPSSTVATSTAKPSTSVATSTLKPSTSAASATVKLTTTTSIKSVLPTGNMLVTSGSISSAPAGTVKASSTASAAPAASSKPVDTTRVGCYTKNTQIVNDFSMDCSTLSPDMCKLLCKYNGLKYAALVEGNNCRCGNTLSGLQSLPDAQCNTQCTGDDSKTCGGTNSMEIFDASEMTLTKPATVGVSKRDDEEERTSNTSSGRIQIKAEREGGIGKTKVFTGRKRTHRLW